MIRTPRAEPGMRVTDGPDCFTLALARVKE